jgi:hypothetical protein
MEYDGLVGNIAFSLLFRLTGKGQGRYLYYTRSNIYIRTTHEHVYLPYRWITTGLSLSQQTFNNSSLSQEPIVSYL